MARTKKNAIQAKNALNTEMTNNLLTSKEILDISLKVNRSKFILGVIGQIIGGLCILLAVFLLWKGFSGQVNWKTNLGGFENQWVNASPGVSLSIAGVMIIFMTRFPGTQIRNGAILLSLVGLILAAAYTYKFVIMQPTYQYADSAPTAKIASEDKNVNQGKGTVTKDEIKLPPAGPKITDWQMDAEYIKDDLVMLKGHLYKCIVPQIDKNSPNSAPDIPKSLYWEVVE